MLRKTTATIMLAVAVLAAGARAEPGLRFPARLKEGKPQAMVTYGTSLTQGGAWVGQVEAVLKTRFPGLVTVINSGQSGVWSGWGVEHLEERVIRRKPDLVFIEFAINDAHVPYNTPVDAARRNLEAMIDRILAARADTEIVLMTMNPCVGPANNIRPNLNAYYQMYRDVAAARKLPLIDHAKVWARIQETDDALFRRYVPDGLHPGPEGCAAVITPAVLQALGVGDKAAAPTALVYDPFFLRHETGAGFPEHPDRLRRLIGHLEESDLGPRLLRLTPDPEIDPLPWIRTVHTEAYIEALRAACERGDRHMHGSPDNPISADSYRVAVRAVAGAMTAVDAVMEGRARNAFAALRPPGHHAMPDRAKGFCLFGNAAIAARYAQRVHGVERVMMVDWDVHHGDGTQEIFYEDPSVFCFSTHQFPFYPGPSGAADRTGAGPGEGFNLNVPLAARSGDAAVREAFTERLAPAFRAFKPQLVIISAGFDAHEADALGGLGWTSGVYAELTRILRELAREQGHERIVSVLEGGYSERAMTEAVQAHLEALAAE
jgi:acetoin utilization deacetylase AcuC-like enzyme/lysophospholipase L1-like esterase